MPNTNPRKRIAHARRVKSVLQGILNDTEYMPNSDCPDLFVTVTRLEFGATVRQIYIDVGANSRHSPRPGEESPHEKYTREARARGAYLGGYDDLTDVLYFRSHLQAIAEELQRRMKLRYTPSLHRL